MAEQHHFMNRNFISFTLFNLVFTDMKVHYACIFGKIEVITMLSLAETVEKINYYLNFNWGSSALSAIRMIKNTEINN